MLATGATPGQPGTDIPEIAGPREETLADTRSCRCPGSVTRSVSRRSVLPDDLQRVSSDAEFATQLGPAPPPMNSSSNGAAGHAHHAPSDRVEDAAESGGLRVIHHRPGRERRKGQLVAAFTVPRSRTATTMSTTPTTMA